MQVDISEVGPCKKHVKVSIPRSEIERQFTESLDDFGKEVAVPGFRPGRAPRQLVDQAVQEAGLRAGQVVAADGVARAARQGLRARSDHPAQARRRGHRAAGRRPDELRDRRRGPAAVRPAGLHGAHAEAARPADHRGRTSRPISGSTSSGTARSCPSSKGPRRWATYITADLVFYRPDGSLLNEVKEIQFRLQPEMRFRDGAIPKLGEALVGRQAGRDAAGRGQAGVTRPASPRCGARPCRWTSGCTT